jgi:succinoglycan biosynthesis protein ExoA
MNQGQINIIIPAPQFNSRLPVLLSLAKCGLDHTRYEILLAEGSHPSRQRNLALQKAHGEFLIFLDSDCRVGRDYFALLEKHVASLEFDVLGGPALLSPESSARQTAFQSALGQSFVTGAAAARYASRGRLRRSDERELILCNLVVRADFFRQTGGFNETLYPNEENEWLDRVQTQARIYYDPDLRVYRPQRETLHAFALMLIRYGIGRTRQSIASRCLNIKQLPPVLLLVWLACLIVQPNAALLAASFFAGLIILVAGLRSSGGLLNRVLTGFAGLCVFFFYAVGQILGSFAWLSPKPDEMKIRILNERGEPVA